MFNRDRVPVWGDEKVQEVGGGDSCTTLNVLNALSCALRW